MVSYISCGHDLKPNISAKKCSLYTFLQYIYLLSCPLFDRNMSDVNPFTHSLVWCPIGLGHLTPSPLCSLSLLTPSHPPSPSPPHTHIRQCNQRPPSCSFIYTCFIHQQIFLSFSTYKCTPSLTHQSKFGWDGNVVVLLFYSISNSLPFLNVLFLNLCEVMSFFNFHKILWVLFICVALNTYMTFCLFCNHPCRVQLAVSQDMVTLSCNVHPIMFFFLKCTCWRYNKFQILECDYFVYFALACTSHESVHISLLLQLF